MRRVLRALEGPAAKSERVPEAHCLPLGGESVCTMRRRIKSVAALPLAVLLSATAWAQIGTPGSDKAADGAYSPPPSAAGTVRTPGTPGASDTPGAMLKNPSTPSTEVSSGPKKKKHSSTPAESSAPVPAN
jgi:hypothetical protein